MIDHETSDQAKTIDPSIRHEAYTYRQSLVEAIDRKHLLLQFAVHRKDQAIHGAWTCGRHHNQIGSHPLSSTEGGRDEIVVENASNHDIKVRAWTTFIYVLLVYLPHVPGNVVSQTNTH